MHRERPVVRGDVALKPEEARGRRARAEISPPSPRTDARPAARLRGFESAAAPSPPPPLAARPAPRAPSGDPTRVLATSPARVSNGIRRGLAPEVAESGETTAPAAASNDVNNAARWRSTPGQRGAVRRGEEGNQSRLVRAPRRGVKRVGVRVIVLSLPRVDRFRESARDDRILARRRGDVQAPRRAISATSSIAARKNGGKVTSAITIPWNSRGFADSRIRAPTRSSARHPSSTDVSRRRRRRRRRGRRRVRRRPRRRRRHPPPPGGCRHAGRASGCLRRGGSGARRRPRASARAAARFCDAARSTACIARSRRLFATA